MLLRGEVALNEASKLEGDGDNEDDEGSVGDDNIPVDSDAAIVDVDGDSVLIIVVVVVELVELGGGDVEIVGIEGEVGLEGVLSSPS